MLEVKELTVRIGDITIVDKVSFNVQQGDWLMIAGPNGAGKSTIINAVSQSVNYTGSVKLDGRDVRLFKPREIAREMGVLTQGHAVAYSFTVEEIVRLGRYAHLRGALSSANREDRESVNEALEIVGMSDKRSQSVLTLSGGELQRVFLAQVLAQNPRLMLLDEPTNHLDLKYQRQIFSLIRDWLKTPGRAAVCVVHDLSLARAYGSKAILLKNGKLIAQGDTVKTLSPQNLSCAYEMDVCNWMKEMSSVWE